MTVAGSLDLHPLLDTLDRHAVEYVVAGSVAAAAHGAEVDPGDVDVVPATEPANLARLASALGELDAEAFPEPGHWETDELDEWHWVTDPEPNPVEPLDPSDPATFDHSYVTRFGRLDVVPVIAGSYQELRARATRGRLAGREAWIADVVDVLAGMTRPRRRKDVPGVRHLRSVAGRAAPSGIGFIGLRTDRFAEMVRLFADLIGLEIIRQAPGATWFRLGTDAELHVYAADDADHAFFTTGPVVGLRVPDVDDARRRMEAAGIEFIGQTQRHAGQSWSHFRAYDGTVLEIID